MPGASDFCWCLALFVEEDIAERVIFLNKILIIHSVPSFFMIILLGGCLGEDYNEQTTAKAKQITESYLKAISKTFNP
ncbi:hypothetical protein CAI16_18575 [Virgibacillus dokdonensis]|uniref:Uncharacterized protein n=1 Tax=Virgibacillus dokdonensis TaxID=302167 RepID=A0A3E0WGZ4_9BACI|nr:hypothetical protein CAI16_18575 [Virgibacillus dokdonensis]